MNLSTTQHDTLAAIADVSIGKGSRGLKSTTAYSTFRTSTVNALLDKGALRVVQYWFGRDHSKHWVHYVRPTVAGFTALAHS